ncbi:MAG: hypothetical protein G8345_09880 [Magnetococcales bacterium]|nr:hypothetical protein [Magnetococcales bacterium]NGZ27179.1 hypothetical protein [Magnetococcales bacterium]
MKVQCPNKLCQTIFEVSVQRLPFDRPKKLRCAYCKSVFYVERPAGESEVEGIPDAEFTMLLNLSNRNRENDAPSFEQYVQQKKYARRPNILPVASESPIFNDPPSFRHDPEPVGDEDVPFMRAAPGGRDIRDMNFVPPPTDQVFQKVSASNAKKSDMLIKTEWLTGLSPEDSLEFAQYWEVFFGRALSPLFKPKERNSFFCLIYSGEIGLYRSEADYVKKNRPLLQLGRGACLGEQSIFRVYPRTLYALLERDAYLLLLTRKQAREMAIHHPHLWQAMANKLLLQLSEIVSQMVAPEQLEVFSVMSKVFLEKG